MYPYEIIFGLDLYQICFAVGFFCCLLYFRFWADRRDFSARFQNLCIIAAVVAVVVGIGSAILTQAFYNYVEDGKFAVTNSTGATFYGGLIGGAAIFLLVYFIGGAYLLPKGETKKHFVPLSEIAGGSIALAHGFGRLGCLFAGCCHGAVTDAWYGIYHVTIGAKTVPVQLFEALFLFALVAFLTYRLHKGQHGNLALYLAIYAIWRFFLEYFRHDDRGQTVISFFTPSQLTAVILFVVGIALLLLEDYWREKQKKTEESGS